MTEVLVRRSKAMSPGPTRRGGIQERRLITPADSSYQNVVLVDANEDAEVEFHLVVNSESLFILSGTFEVRLNNNDVEVVQPGDLIYFPSNYSHALRCAKGPGQLLAIFAPARGAMTATG
jgi:quercetin dioxygenase-like cupin family protein